MEFIYFMHTPAADPFKVGIFTVWMFAISHVLLWDQERLAEVYKRKRMRHMKIQKDATQLESRESWELKQ